MRPRVHNIPIGVCGTPGCHDPECKIPYGYCHCGCGRTTNLGTITNLTKEFIRRVPRRYIHGHSNHPKVNVHIGVCGTPGCHDPECSIPFGYCHCGCGLKTKVSSKNVQRDEYLANMPRVYISGHSSRGKPGKPGKTLELAGQRFGRLTVVEKIGTRNGKAYWKCVCDCGEIREVESGSLTSGNTTSCGCRRDEAVKRANFARHDGIKWDERLKKWRVTTEIDGELVSLGLFKDKDRALLAAAEARAIYHDYPDDLEKLPPSPYRIKQFRRRVYRYDLPNIQWQDDCGSRPWQGYVNEFKGGIRKTYRSHYTTPEEACLWAMHKKLELGHRGRAKTLKLIEELEAAIAVREAAYVGSDGEAR